MQEPKAWPVLDETHLQDCRVFSVGRARVRSPHTGDEYDFFRIDSNDWVNVVALTSDDELVMVRQFRHGERAVTLEIPGGLVDDGERPADAAARELLEETGYRAGSVRAIGSVNPNPAIFGNRVYSFVASGCERVAAIQNEGSEHTQLALVPRSEVRARVQAGAIDHALVLAGLYYWELDAGL